LSIATKIYLFNQLVNKKISEAKKKDKEKGIKRRRAEKE
jgi:hypothetical protein